MTRPGPQPNEYLLGHSANEEERLRRQPQELAPDSRRLLDQLDIRPGDRAIDIGCGPQGILDLLSERVGARGKVVGFERSESTVHLAKQFIVEHDLRACWWSLICSFWFGEENQEKLVLLNGACVSDPSPENSRRYGPAC